MAQLDFFKEELEGQERCGAILSPCERYRYVLWRCWEKGKPFMLVVGFNPSTADATRDDPTLRRCVNFAKRDGYGGLWLLNLFAYRTTSPKELLQVDDPIGEQNDQFLREYGQQKEPGVRVAAWGSLPLLLKNSPFKHRDSWVEALVCPPETSFFCWKKTADGFPGHPFYLEKNSPLVPF